jgi:hypothetical protein
MAPEVACTTNYTNNYLQAQVFPEILVQWRYGANADHR